MPFGLISVHMMQRTEELAVGLKSSKRTEGIRETQITNGGARLFQEQKV